MARAYQRRCKTKEQREIDKWRRTRLVATILRNVNRGENEPSLTPEEFLPLPDDAPPQPVEVMSEDEFNRIAAL
jgi:hypothetical protein